MKKLLPNLQIVTQKRTLIRHFLKVLIFNNDISLIGTLNCQIFSTFNKQSQLLIKNYVKFFI